MVAEKKVAHQQRNAISRFYGETVGELKKVTWPTRREATNLTTIVLIVIASMAVVLGILDIVFSRVFAYLLSL